MTSVLCKVFFCILVHFALLVSFRNKGVLERFSRRDALCRIAFQQLVQELDSLLFIFVQLLLRLCFIAGAACTP